MLYLCAAIIGSFHTHITTSYATLSTLTSLLYV